MPQIVKSKERETIMPQDALSQDDIDRLLHEMQGNAGADVDEASPTGEPNAMAATATIQPHQEQMSRRLRNYDFRRPNRISKEYMRSLRLIHETFAREIPRNWGMLLRAGGQVKIASMEQTIYEEFRNHLAPQCFICTIGMPPLEGEIAFQIDLDAAFIIVDRLLGGAGNGLKRSRELTSLELSILQRVVVALLPAWREAWLPVLHIEPSLNRTFASTEFLQLTTLNESVLVTTFIAYFLGTEIEVTACIPYSLIAPVMTRLVTPGTITGYLGSDEIDRQRMARHMQNTTVTVAARLGAAPIPIVDLAQLAVGDVIRLDVPSEGEALIHIGPQPYFIAKPGLSNGSLAVQILDTVRGRKNSTGNGPATQPSQ